MADDEHLTKVHINLPNHCATGGESVWARDLGGDLYELRNSPFHAYDLNFGDIVQATADHPELKPEVRCVVKRSGNRTLRVFFEKAATAKRQAQLLSTLKPLAVSYERATQHLVALDLEPEANVLQVRAVLDAWEQEGIGCYETCEARVPGSFDDAPQEEA